MTDSFRIAGHEIGADRPCFLIAEAGVNHDGSVDRALELVDAAAWSGADAVKFQTFKAERLVTEWASKASYQAKRTGAGETQADMLRRLELPEVAWPDIARRCEQHGLVFLSTPFDEVSAELLYSLGMPAIKVPSGELTNLQMIARFASEQLPMIVSTGMGTLDEVADAVEAVRTAGAPPLALLHCVSDYPAAPRDANLRAMATMRERFGVPVGWSDHTEGRDVAIAAAALGADIVEKHFTLDRNADGPDHAASLEPRELAALVRSIRCVEEAMGDGRKVPRPNEQACAASSRRSLVLATDLEAGSVITADVLRARRPGTGIPPSRLADVVGCVLTAPVAAHVPLTWDLIT